MLFWLWPRAAEAHVRWFVDTVEITVAPYQFSEALVWLALGCVLAGITLATVLQRFEQRWWQRFQVSEKTIRISRGIGLAIVLLGSWFVHSWMELLPYVGYVLYIILIRKQPKLALALLTAGVGISFSLLAFDEKLLHPELAAMFLQDHPWNFGMDVRTFILFAGCIELTLGLLLTFGLSSRFASVLVLLTLTATAVALGPVELLGHLPIAAALILFLLERPNGAPGVVPTRSNLSAASPDDT